MKFCMTKAKLSFDINAIDVDFTYAIIFEEKNFFIEKFFIKIHYLTRMCFLNIFLVSPYFFSEKIASGFISTTSANNNKS